MAIYHVIYIEKVIFAKQIHVTAIVSLFLNQLMNICTKNIHFPIYALVIACIHVIWFLAPRDPLAEPVYSLLLTQLQVFQFLRPLTSPQRTPIFVVISQHQKSVTENHIIIGFIRSGVWTVEAGKESTNVDARVVWKRSYPRRPNLHRYGFMQPSVHVIPDIWTSPISWISHATDQ